MQGRGCIGKNEMQKRILLLIISLLFTACAAMQSAALEINLMGLVVDEVVTTVQLRISGISFGTWP